MFCNLYNLKIFIVQFLIYLNVFSVSNVFNVQALIFRLRFIINILLPPFGLFLIYGKHLRLNTRKFMEWIYFILLKISKSEIYYMSYINVKIKIWVWTLMIIGLFIYFTFSSDTTAGKSLCTVSTIDDSFDCTCECPHQASWTLSHQRPNYKEPATCI